MARYELVEVAESAAAFHGRVVDDDARPQIWWNHLTAPALVLGSTQRDLAIVDEGACHHAGVEIVRRRSGGGAVLLVPGEVTWIDVIVPAGSPGWADDVHGPMVWLGEHLAAVIDEVLTATGVAGVTGGSDPASAGVTVHRGAMITTEWSSLVCFDGFGPGEVSLDGVKLVGMSQRRTRGAARLQCSWYGAYDPELMVSLLADDVRPDAAALRPVATLDHVRSRMIPALLRDRLGTNGEEMGRNG